MESLIEVFKDDYEIRLLLKEKAKDAIEKMTSDDLKEVIVDILKADIGKYTDEYLIIDVDFLQATLTKAIADIIKEKLTV